jgi:predicted XRE-type DNA-binding protein
MGRPSDGELRICGHGLFSGPEHNTYRVYVTLMRKSARGKDWRKDPLENTPPVRGSGNFLKDRGYSDPTETRIKFDLVNVIRVIVEAKNLRQIDVVALVGRYAPGAGISQPDISRILRGNVNGYSESRLIVILAALSNNVSIVVEPTKGHGRICVR